MSYLQEYSEVQVNGHSIGNHLHYDDIAFVSYACAIALIAVVLLISMICNDAKESRVPEEQTLSSFQIFNTQLQNTHIIKRKTIRSTKFVAKIVFLCVSCSIIFLAVFHQRPQFKELSTDKEHSSVKPNDARFRTRDGIALPSLLLAEGYQWIVLLVTLLVMLVIIPKAFIQWYHSEMSKDQNGLFFIDYEWLYGFLTPKFNLYTPMYCLASLAQVSADKSEKESNEGQVKNILQAHNMNEDIILLEEYSGSQWNALLELMTCVNIQEISLQRMLLLSTNLERILHFFLPFSMKKYRNKHLNDQLLYPIRFLGQNIILQTIYFMRRFYHCKILVSRPISLIEMNLDLEESQAALAELSNQKSFQRFLQSEENIDRFIAKLRIQRRKYVEKQLKNIPLLDFQLTLQIAGQPVTSMLTTDYAQIHYKVSKRRLNVPYCSSSYPLLKKELFYFILLNNFNVIRFEPVVFEPNQLGISHKFQYRQSSVRSMQLIGYIVSDFYTGIDVKRKLGFQVSEPQLDCDTPIQHHPEDQFLLKRYKSFSEQLFEEEEEESDEEENDEEKNETQAHNKKMGSE